MTVTVVPVVAGNRYRSLNCCLQQAPEMALFSFAEQQYWSSRQSATNAAPDAPTAHEPLTLVGASPRKRVMASNRSCSAEGTGRYSLQRAVSSETAW